MFLHEMTEHCIFNPCQYKHVEEIVTVEDDTHDGPMNDDQSESKEVSLNENTCHLCMKQLTTKDDLYDHTERNHDDFY